ncbi:MFS general substrate transporter [Aspergillus niger ATCC 13496]|uniref:MFS general substrate transporter n=1 Tax=Aspergillus niger ATCC 13496 TaxID=1353008 RepID=A0A370BWE3_ASPNG|nr:MFS general substrate transporter [Aspergillus niger ATCC 13496]
MKSWMTLPTSLCYLKIDDEVIAWIAWCPICTDLEQRTAVPLPRCLTPLNVLSSPILPYCRRIHFVMSRIQFVHFQKSRVIAIANPSNYSVPATNAANDTPETQRSEPPATQPYTLFTSKTRMFIVIIVGFATITSPLTATTQFETSRQAIDITLTIYISFQAVSPAIFGPLSDSVGRRPTYLLTLAIYALANLGMALKNPTMSLGASASFAISYGIVADVCVPSERGRMMGWVSMALNLGTCVGPIMGGLVVYLSGDIGWVFWALFIVGILLFFVVGILLPETGRNIVGNGSDRTKVKAWYRCWWSYITAVGFLLNKKNDTREEKPAGNTEQSPSGQARKSIFTQLNIRMFLVPLRIIFFPDAFCCLWMHGSFYAVEYILAATVSDIFMHTYQFNTLLTGLAYFPQGIGIIGGGYCNGRIMDYNYEAMPANIIIQLIESMAMICVSSQSN